MMKLQAPHKDALQLVLKSLYARDVGLYKHSMLTANIARTIVEETNIDFGCTKSQAFIAGLLHDVGKTTVPDLILFKNGCLDEREWEIMQRHPVWGHDYVTGTVFESYANIILHHHEIPSGKGYPYGLSTDEITNNVKLIALADRISAFLEDRPYRRKIVDIKIIHYEIMSTVKLLFEDEIYTDSIVSVVKRFASNMLKTQSTNEIINIVDKPPVPIHLVANNNI